MAAALRAGGRFVLCDVVLTEQPAPRPVPVNHEHDTPSTMGEQVAWLSDAGLEPTVVFAEADVCILAGDRPPG